MSSLRVLVVDDYEPFCEASDGLEALQKAEELQPHLIVLNIGLPTLNGIEVARRIRKSCPQCKMLFMTQASSADVAQEAFSLGAMGYVVKAHAGGELLAALESVCQGRRFVSRGLSGLDRTALVTTSSRPPLPSGSSPIAGTGQVEVVHGHEVQFYSDDESFLHGFARFVEGALAERQSR